MCPVAFLEQTKHIFVSDDGDIVGVEVHAMHSRSEERPRRIQDFAVPNGSRNRPAISPWVYPPTYAIRMPRLRTSSSRLRAFVQPTAPIQLMPSRHDLIQLIGITQDLQLAVADQVLATPVT